MGVEKNDTRKVNNSVPLGMIAKAPYAMTRISKVEINKKSKAEARKRTTRPTSMKPGQFAKAYPAPVSVEVPAAMNAD